MNISEMMMHCVSWLGQTFMPLVTCYHLMTSNLFLNTAATDAQGLEKWANMTLAPVQYILAGSSAIACREGDSFYYELEQRFDYHHHFALITTACAIAFPISLIFGSLLKGIAYLSAETHARHYQIARALSPDHIYPHTQFYQNIGIAYTENEIPERAPSLGYLRKPEDHNNLRFEKEALREIVALLTEYKIPFWADCGTCLGAYRYGGAIPWDLDIDLGVLLPDFDNVRKALQRLDPSKYIVQDWSNRMQPKTLLRVYVYKTCNYIDIYHFNIHPDKKTLQTVLSGLESIFMAEIWKQSQQRYLVETPFDLVFPLKTALFDGIEIPVPAQMKRYLQQRYGEDLSPVKIFDPKTNHYEKDLQHPYWKTAPLD